MKKFCKKCKKARSKVPLKPKSPFKWVFMDVIPATSPKSLTNDTNFKIFVLIVDAYSKLPKLYGMKNITTEEVLDKLDMFQSRFGKSTNLVGGIWKEFQQMQELSLPRRSLKRNVKFAVFA